MAYKKIVEEISNNVFLLKLVEKDTKFFEALWEIPEGVTYNAYLIKTKEGSVLIDGWKAQYSQEFVNELESLVDLSDIRYMVVNHMEPDHSGSIPAIIERNKDMIILGHPMVKSMIKSFYGLEVQFQVVKDLETLSFGGEEFTFIHTPGVHWPETIMTYMKRGILFSCDAFGSYTAIDEVFDYELSEDDFKKYIENAVKYFATVVGHYREFAFRALKKVESLNLNITMVAPSHGLILKNKIQEFFNLYESLSSGRPVWKEIAVIYSSMYGFMERVMSKLLNNLKKNGVNYFVAKFTDTNRDIISEIIGKVYASPAIILGISTYEMTIFPLMMYIIDLIIQKTPPKPVVIVSDYGWSSGAAKVVKEKLEKAGFDVVGVIEIKGMLTKEKEAEIEMIAKELASKL